MNYQFIIKNETPAKKNSRINLRNGVSIPSKRYTAWHEDSLRQLHEQRKPIEPINTPVIIRLSFCHGDLRRRDSDNGCSSIMDLLTDAGILLDDNWQIVREIKIFNSYSKNDAYCEINITDFEE